MNIIWHEMQNLLIINIYMIYTSLSIMMIIAVNSQVGCHCELCNSIYCSPFIKDGPMYPLLKEAIEEALKLLS